MATALHRAAGIHACAQLIFVLSHLALADVAAADVQVNSADSNAPNLGNFTTESETNVAVSGKLVVVGFNTSRQAGLLGSGGWNSLSGFAYSANGGTSFTDGNFVPSGGSQLEGDPALAIDSAGTVYYASIGADSGGTSRIFVSQSTATSPAVTFASPVLISGLLGGSAPFQDKELIAVDRSGGQFDGRVYVAWSEFPSIFSSSARVLVAASSAQSPLAFSTPIGLSPSTGLNHGAMPAVAANGDVYVVWASFSSTVTASAEQVHVVRSTNGGGAFANPDPADPNPDKVVASFTSTIGNMNSGGINIRTRGFPYLAIDHTPAGSATRDHLYIVFQATPGGGSTARAEILFTSSSDRGVTWSAPRDITSGLAATIGADTTANDNWQPAIAVSPTTGHLRVTFYSRRQDPANTQIRVYEALSTDGGLTWATQPLSATAFTPSTGYDPLLVSTYMGDYIHSATDGSAFNDAWGDTRNTCAPPAGATAPCSPAGRGDQDVFFAASGDPSGPDPFITPWGAVTGNGPLWQSPDIFVVDAFSNPTNAEKGTHNRLRGRVRNIGSAPEATATVRFRYAPAFVGLSDAAFKIIATPTVTLAAAGDPSGNDLQVIPVDWDLTNTADTNGGLWPMPISAFDHFCTQVDIQSTDDINLSNNHAQTNFVDVTDASSYAPLAFRFMIGNPFERPIKARLVVSELPAGFGARLEEGYDREPVLLKAREIKVGRIVLERPRDYREARRTKDVVVNISMMEGSHALGGLSVRLAKTNGEVEHPRAVAVHLLQAESRRSPAPEPKAAETFVIESANRSSTAVARAAAEIFRARKLPVALEDLEHGLVSSGSIPLNAEELRRFVDASRLKGMPADGVGRYLLSVKAEERGADRSRITVSVRVILGNPVADSPIGGRTVPSNGTLEREFLAALTQQLELKR